MLWLKDIPFKFNCQFASRATYLPLKPSSELLWVTAPDQILGLFGFGT